MQTVRCEVSINNYYLTELYKKAKSKQSIPQAQELQTVTIMSALNKHH